MSIIRGPRPESGYSILRNAIVRDDRLSFKARGLLAYLLSHDEGWRVSADLLAQQGPDGRTAILSGMKELEEAGYLVRVKDRSEDGTFATHTVVYEEPQTESPVCPKSGFPTSDERPSDNPLSIEVPSQEQPSKNKDAAPPQAGQPAAPSAATQLPPANGTTATPLAGAVPEPTVNQRANLLAKAYCDARPMSNFPAVAGIVRKAINAGHPDEDITLALGRIIANNRSLSVEILRVELEGHGDYRQGRQSGTQRYVEASRELGQASPALSAAQALAVEA
jgi:hypothetical protein